MNINSNKSLYIKICFNYGSAIFEGKVLSTATGVFVRYKEKVFLITNRHVVRGKNNFTNEYMNKENAGIPN